MLLRKIINKGGAGLNYRNTKQKVMILSIIDKHGHLTIEQIKSLLEDQNVSIATIYRNLNILTQEGKIKRVASDNLTLYETIKEKHYHFECEICKQVYDIDPKLIKIKSDKTITGVNNVGLFLYGICDNCKK